MPEPRYFTVGRVLRPHGVQGELRVEILTEHPSQLEQYTHLYLVHPDHAEDVRRYRVKKIRRHVNVLLLTLEGCSDRTHADEFRGLLVQAPVEKAAPLKEDEYYHHQLVGMDVVTEENEPLGQLVEILITGANDVYIVRGDGGDILLPATSNVIRQVDPQARRMVVHLLPGLRDGGAGR